ncbi:hypothetical protein TUZN_0001 [Thermoproteus uzoniensis 768-20]|uniref:Uncharacterized protein n=1 Tax=Thermoproteus uzoniensis (strain 768-20) TaxID=999630 RepID=F2L0M9_THEU7|nr:hypothetical protein TUZN_0001 [Thermoproteus uzoniensis 768-20]
MPRRLADVSALCLPLRTAAPDPTPTSAGRAAALAAPPTPSGVGLLSASAEAPPRRARQSAGIYVLRRVFKMSSAKA